MSEERLVNTKRKSKGNFNDTFSRRVSRKAKVKFNLYWIIKYLLLYNYTSRINLFKSRENILIKFSRDLFRDNSKFDFKSITVYFNNNYFARVIVRISKKLPRKSKSFSRLGKELIMRAKTFDDSQM